VAEAHFKEGRKLYQVGDYRGALDAFKKAFMAKEDAVLLFNIAQCHRQLGDDRQAIVFYRRYLADEPRAANRSDVERFIREGEARIQEAEAPVAAPGPYPPPPPPAPAPPAPAATVPVAVKPRPSPARVGLHLAVALGAGAFRDDFNWSVLKGSATGGSGAAQLAAGVWLAQRLVLGAAVILESVQAPRIEIQGLGSDTVSVGAIAFLGVYGDLRLAPERAGGFHIQAAVGGARMTLEDQSGEVMAHEPAGGGGMIGGGYRWPFRGFWEVGILGRFMVLTMKDAGVSHRVEALSVLGHVSFR
jgi:hypothetical protein